MNGVHRDDEQSVARASGWRLIPLVWYWRLALGKAATEPFLHKSRG